MKLRFTLICLLFSSLLLNAQPSGKKIAPGKNSGGPKTTSNANRTTKAKSNNDAEQSTKDVSAEKTDHVTGIWRGYFVQSTLGILEDKYRFEVQVAEQENHSLQAVTYSYKTTVFYGKADASGIYTAKSKNFLLKELKLTDVKLTDKSSGACLMTCYLDYDKIGKTETLSGTYTSVSIKDKSDCGNGRVYLEKTPVTDFYKEDFLVKRETELKNKEKSKKVATKNTNKYSDKTIGKKPIIKPGAEDDVIAAPISKPKTDVLAADPKKESSKPTPPAVIKTFPKPQVMKTRENDLQKTLETNEKEFKVELYDNGEIDGDRISVYHNNELIVSDKMLTDKPITFTIHADENVPIHDFVMVAENLGSIPPNTALMIITAGSQRYELFITSNNQKNAVVRVEYKADSAK